ncbi:MAG: imidazoleglycerol-phosphate dehydratase HisB [Clostridiales bacterium]|jgi:imidazoleglycerol-phosphate dehydratase|nr:imidazoleglycerol-phosphate dehydratase HisB [Clostridiales bacterium]
MRIAKVKRSTAETCIEVEVNLDGTGANDLSTNIGFLDHMLHQVSRHGFFDISVSCKGDLEVDCHHSVEDIGIALGQAVKDALGNKDGIKRYGSAYVPMEDSLVLCVIDFSGRPYLSFDAKFETEKIGEFDTELVEEFFRAFAMNGACDLHIKKIEGKNSHHLAEAIFKAFAKAMDQATARDPRITGPLSTKGAL